MPLGSTDFQNEQVCGWKTTHDGLNMPKKRGTSLLRTLRSAISNHTSAMEDRDMGLELTRTPDRYEMNTLGWLHARRRRTVALLE